MSLQNKFMPKAIFVLRKDEVPGEWRKVHNEKQWDFHESPNKLARPLPKARKMGGVRWENSIEVYGG
jgi:hypothetical protein